MPVTPYNVSGTIRNSDNYLISNAQVYIKNVTKDEQTDIQLTDAVGKFIINLAEISYSAGDSCIIYGEDKSRNETGNTSFTVSGASKSDQEVSLSTRERFEGSSQQGGTHLLSTGGNMISKENRLPVDAYEKDYNKMIAYVTGTSRQEYIGIAGPGTPTSSAKWKIQKLTWSGTKLVSITWANGTSDFDKVWDNRASYSYS